MFQRLSPLLLTLGVGAAVAGPAFAQDSDGDGVVNAADTHPCDPRRASTSFFPGEETGALLLFEDQWPGATDLDFNDVALRANYRFERDAEGRVVSIHATFSPAALGGMLSNGLGLQLPVSQAGVVARRRVGSGAWEALPLQPDALATFLLSPDVRELYDHAEGLINVRTDDLSTRIGHRLEVEVVFETPAAMSLAQAPFDVFVFRSGNLGHQIHFPQYGGTAAMDASLFGSTPNDGSTATRRFVNSNKIPAALNLMDAGVMPREGAPISRLYPDIVPFARSGGTRNQDFYLTRRDFAFGIWAYYGGHFQRPPVDESCVPVPTPGFVEVPGGAFTAGVSSPAFDARWEPDIAVVLTRSFEMQATEVTLGQWKALSGGLEPSRDGCGESCADTGFDRDTAPVDRVTWWSTLGYANALSVAHGLQPCYVLPDSCSGAWEDGTLDCGFEWPTFPRGVGGVLSCEGYRLPTAAEWERAARGGTATDNYAGDFDSDHVPTDPRMDLIAWYIGNSGRRTHAVGTKQPNAYGLHDMLGNVAEWTWNGYEEVMAGGPDPVGPEAGEDRVIANLCGASCYAHELRPGLFDYMYPMDRELGIGFRLVRSTDTSPAGFVRVPAGTFQMGTGGSSPENDVSATLTRDYYLQATEVTQRQWKRLSGGLAPAPARDEVGDDESFPVTDLTWWSALAYLNALSASQGLPPCYVLPAGCTGQWENGSLVCGPWDRAVAQPALEPGADSVHGCAGYRLPTDAEWERAARAGTTTDTYAGDILVLEGANDPVLDGIAWHYRNAVGGVQLVGRKAPNAYGLYDILGNTMEWVWDVWTEQPQGGIDPVASSVSLSRMTRGGTTNFEPEWCRAAARDAHRHSWQYYGRVGFRPARTVNP